MKLKIFGAVAVSILLFFVLHTYGKLFLTKYLICYLWFLPTIFLLCLFIKKRGPIEEDIVSIIGLIVSLVLSLSSSWLHYKWFYFLLWEYRPTSAYMNVGILQFVYLSQIFIPIIIYFRRRLILILLIIFIVIQIMCIAVFYSNLSKGMLYQDDGPCFMYRMWEFSRAFPHLVNYSPYWNAGFIDRSLITTGGVLLGIIFYPIWKFCHIGYMYGYILGFLFIILIPLLYVFLFKKVFGNWTSSLISGILSIGVSQYYFLWLLQYGTPSALLSSSLLVLFALGVYRVLWQEKKGFLMGLWIFLTCLFLILWPLGVIMMGLVMGSVLLNFRRLGIKKMRLFSICFALIFIIYIWLFLGYREGISEITGRPNIAIFSTIFRWDFLKNGLTYLTDHIKMGHPLLVFLGLGGIFFLNYPGIRAFFIPILLGLMFLVFIGKEIMAELQLYRMAVPMFYICIVPSSLLISKVLDQRDNRLTIFQTILVSLLIMGGLACIRMYANKGFARYIVIGENVEKLINWIKENTPKDGRILFAGSTGHAYGKGRVSFMPYLAEREFMAGDFFQFSLTSPIPTLPPEWALKSKESLAQYVDLYNITHVITYDEDLKEIFRRYTDCYREEISIGDKTIFSVNRGSTLFLKGRGRIVSDFNCINVFLDEPFHEVVIKYNWADGLSASPPAQIQPFEVGNGIRFISIQPNGSNLVEIRYRRLRRVLGT